MGVTPGSSASVTRRIDASASRSPSSASVDLGRAGQVVHAVEGVARGSHEALEIEGLHPLHQPVEGLHRALDGGGHDRHLEHLGLPRERENSGCIGKEVEAHEQHPGDEALGLELGPEPGGDELVEALAIESEPAPLVPGDGVEV